MGGIWRPDDCHRVCHIECGDDAYHRGHTFRAADPQAGGGVAVALWHGGGSGKLAERMSGGGDERDMVVCGWPGHRAHSSGLGAALLYLDSGHTLRAPALQADEAGAPPLRQDGGMRAPRQSFITPLYSC